MLETAYFAHKVSGLGGETGVLGVHLSSSVDPHEAINQQLSPLKLHKRRGRVSLRESSLVQTINSEIFSLRK